MGLHFISYSHVDGEPFADWLYQELKACPEPIDPWMDAHNMLGGFPFEEALKAAIANCESLLLVWTRDTINSKNCATELRLAGEYPRPIIPLRIHRDAEEPYVINGIQPIDFPRNRNHRKRPLERLIRMLSDIQSPPGRIEIREKQIAVLRRDLKRARHAAKRSIQQRIAQLQSLNDEDRHVLQELAEDPEGSRKAVKEGFADEYPRRGAAQRDVSIRYIPGPLPQLSGQPEFLDRKNEKHILDRLVANDRLRLLVVHGQEGIGKTRMVLQVLEGCDAATGSAKVDAVVFRSAQGLRRYTLADLLADLREATPEGRNVRSHAGMPALEQLDVVIAELADARVVVAIDDAEELLAPETAEFRDPLLGAAIDTLVDPSSHHRVTLLFITSIIPKAFEGDRAQRMRLLPVDDGLPREDARFLLQALDVQGIMGIEETPEVFDGAYELTKGFPRSLEALYGTLALPGTRYCSLAGLLDAIPSAPPDEVLGFLTGEMFNNLDPAARHVSQALAVYDRPVLPGAVDHLLELHYPGEQSKRVLERLLHSRLIRREGKKYYLPHADAARLLERIPEGVPSDRDDLAPRFTRFWLFHRAAGYYAMAREHLPEPQNLEDLGVALAEIDLRIQGRQYTEALNLLAEIDDGYLLPWGLSYTAVTHREQLIGELGDDWDELVNLAALGDADAQRDEPERAISHYKSAMEYARKLDSIDTRQQLLISLGCTLAEQGRLEEAFDRFMTARGIARDLEMPAQEATALANIAHYHAIAGNLTFAVELAHEALHLIDSEPTDDLQAKLSRNVGCWEGQLGHPVSAIDWLQRSRLLAQRSGSLLTEGQALVDLSEVLIDQGRVARAMDAADQASRIAERLGNASLLRAAKSSIALAHLCAGSLAEARRAIDLACRYPAPRRAFPTLNLQGVIALLQSEVETAVDALAAAIGETAALRRRNEKDFDVLYNEGLAWFALGFCEPRYLPRELNRRKDPFDQAIEAFREARAITPAPGTVNRILRLVCELGELGAPGRLTAILRAAAGTATEVSSYSI